jgi:hypothetical protein
MRTIKETSHTLIIFTVFPIKYLAHSHLSSISLFDGSPITEFDVLPASASGLL